MAAFESLLRSEGPFAAGRGVVRWQPLLLWGVLGGIAYGTAMGSYGGVPLQSLYSGLKVPLLTFGTMALCLPSAYAVNTALGLRDDFSAVLRGILVTQGTVCGVLLAFAPITLVAYSGCASKPAAVVANGLVFALATGAGQLTLARHYRPLVERDRKHRVGWLGWSLLYVFVAIQLAWVLRPWLGSEGLETTFFRETKWGNAYVYIADVVWRLLAF